MAKKAPKTRNPQDTTLRNIRALKKRVDTLEEVVGNLLHTVKALRKAITAP